MTRDIELDKKALDAAYARAADMADAALMSFETSGIVSGFIEPVIHAYLSALSTPAGEPMADTPQEDESFLKRWEKIIKGGKPAPSGEEMPPIPTLKEMIDSHPKADLFARSQRP